MPPRCPCPPRSAYEAALEAAGIVVSCAERRARLERQVHALAFAAGGRVVADPHLLDTLAEIVEFPTIIAGAFPESFLTLPKEVLVTSLAEHQKAFCVENEAGELLPAFLTAANRPDDPDGFLKSGNEWVLRARLYDARFFFDEDRRQPLLGRLREAQAPHLPARAGQLSTTRPSASPPWRRPSPAAWALDGTRPAGWWPRPASATW